jgi:hypothetical protein
VHPSPEVENRGTLFIDGPKLMLVGLILYDTNFYHLGYCVWQ